MTLGFLGKKLGMTQRFTDNGNLIPVTVLLAGPCTVVQKKTADRDGYSALQLAFEPLNKPGKVTRALKGHFSKAKTQMFKHLKEFRVEDVEKFNVGDELSVKGFVVGDLLNVRGRTKGRGFQGVVKRHGKHGGGSSHGSHFHRAPGSIGMCTDPGRVIKNMGMPGHMGNEVRTIKNLAVIDIDIDNNLVFVKGAVPASKNGLVTILNRATGFEKRFEKTKDEGRETKSE